MRKGNGEPVRARAAIGELHSCAAFIALETVTIQISILPPGRISPAGDRSEQPIPPGITGAELTVRLAIVIFIRFREQILACLCGRPTVRPGSVLRSLL